MLAERDFHRGKVLLWTTDLDDLEWTDLGVARWSPCCTRPSRKARRRAHRQPHGGFRSFFRDLDANALARPRGDRASARTRASIPSGPSPVQAEGGRLRVGPFDKLGLHRVVSGTRTPPRADPSPRYLAFAVNLAARALRPRTKGTGRPGTRPVRRSS